MKALATVASFMAFFVLAGCGAYNARQVPLTKPNYMSYCQRQDGMAVGMEPYMVKDKTALVFDGNLRHDCVMALNVSMLADPGVTYKVKRSEITAVDEFGNRYSPSDASLFSDRIERALRRDKPALPEDVKNRELPDEATVTDNLTQGFVYFDMEPNHADARRFTVSIPAVSADGSRREEFNITVDPMRDQMNPMERWDSYNTGVTTCGMTAMKGAGTPSSDAEAARRAEEAAKRAEEAAARAEKSADKGVKAFEKGLVK